MESRVINSEPGRETPNDGPPDPADSGPVTDASVGPSTDQTGTRSGPAEAVAPRPAWVHAAPTPEQLLEHAERAVGDRYRIETIAGTGGMGRVFSARDTRLGRRVAIKLLTVLDPNPGEDPGLRAHARLVAEARAMASLDHPGLCRVAEVSLIGQTPFLAMEWVEGVPFDKHCRGLDARRALTVLLRVLDAAAAIHAEGLVHGDLKPANVLIKRNGDPVIVDFGLARAESDPSWADPPKGGTPGYVAPELIKGGHAIGPGADVFAAGVMLYQILTGRTPFYKNLSAAVTVDLLERGALPLPEEHAPDTPPDLQKICLVALEADPAHRYRDAAAMAGDIRRYLRRETVAARPRILQRRLDEQIDAQIAQMNEWQRLGMITPRDTESVARTLAELGTTESPWITDARRLRASQISLSLGGWILLLGLAVGLTQTRSAIPPAVAAAAAWVIAAAVLALGLRLQAKGQKRIGFGALATAQIALPAALWLTLGGTPLPTAPAGAGTADAIAAIAGGLATGSTLAVSVAGFALAAVLRRVTHSPVFTVFTVLFGMLAWVCLYPVLGGLDADPMLAVGRWGVWLAVLGFVTLPLALAIDAREHDLIRRLGRVRARRRDATPILCGSLAATAAGLTAAALAAPAWFAVRRIGEVPSTAGLHAWALFINGLLLTALLFFIGGEPTPLRRRTAGALRWIVPAHLLIPLVVMDIESAWGVWLPWFAAVPAIALAFCFAGAPRQWTPFLISGLAGIAVWYARVFARIESELADHSGWRLAAAAAFLVLGPALILVAWKTPAWIATRRLRRWAIDNPIRRSTRSRSWR